MKATFPHGQITVKVVKGGLDVVDEENDDVTAIASAAIAVRVDIPGKAKALGDIPSSSSGRGMT